MSLDRFLQAQETRRSYERAFSELKAGEKASHWMWWIFPQKKGLGTSKESHFYGINDAEEALAFLEHPVLGARYRECVGVVYGQLCENGLAPLVLMGGNDVDVMKLRSSLGLFLKVAPAGESVFRGQAEKILKVLG